MLKGIELPQVPQNKALRESLEGKSLEELTAILSQMKTLHNSTDVDNCKRAIRAIEIQTYYQENPHLEVATKPHPIENALVIGVDIDVENRRRRITERLKTRLADGMIDEVRRLIDSGISPDDLIYYGLEYKFLTQHVIVETTREEMFRLLEIAIHQFAKRQMTWFRGMERRGFHINWLPWNLSDEEFVQQVLNLRQAMKQ